MFRKGRKERTVLEEGEKAEKGCFRKRRKGVLKRGGRERVLGKGRRQIKSVL